MNLPDSFAIQKYHRDRILKFGSQSSRALGWTTSEGQQARFKVITDLLGDLSNKSLVDAGCGHGDLRGFLGNNFSKFSYIGIDQIANFLDIAIERYGNYPDTNFYLGDFYTAELPLMDYVVACGALSYCCTDPHFVLKAITKLFHTCKFALVFNLLKKIETQEKIIMAYDPEIILAHCKTLSEHVVLKEGYFGEDYTIMVKRSTPIILPL